jgi:cytochrome c oxidase subunit 4
MTATAPAPAAHEGTRPHPSDRNYVQIAAILAVITGAEIAMSYADVATAIFVPVLLVMMVAKFFIVVAWFMHLRFDHQIFRRLFIAGLVLAVAVFMVFLTAMQVFGDDKTSEHRHALGGPPAATAFR